MAGIDEQGLTGGEERPASTAPLHIDEINIERLCALGSQGDRREQNHRSRPSRAAGTIIPVSYRIMEWFENTSNALLLPMRKTGRIDR